MNFGKYFHSTALISLGVCALAAAQPALASEAQSDPTAPADEVDAPGGGLGDIVVTAEKRPSNVQRTAISIGVVDAEALKRNNVVRLTDLASIAPSVSFATSNAATIVVIRGVSSRDTTEIGDPAVSISIDGFNLQRALGLNTAMFDLERVEVLRGPQGTLVGRNATGGAINIITAKPVDDFAASLTGGIGNYSAYTTGGMINIPISDTLKVRAAFQTNDRAGFRENAPGKDGDDDRSKAARVTLAFDPTSRLSILLTGEYVRIGGVGPVTQSIPQRFYTAADVPAGLNVGDVRLDRPDIPGNGRAFPQPLGAFTRFRSWNIRSTIEYDFDFAKLTYVGGYRTFRFERRSTLGGVYGTRRQNFTFNAIEKPKSQNHELRLSSNGDGPLIWQFGGYYFREKNNLISQFHDYPGSPALTGTPFIVQNFVYPDIEAKAKALFGQASYEVLPGFKLEAGARYSDDSKRRVGFNTATNLNTYLNTNCTQATCVFNTNPQNSQVRSKQWTYHAAANYEITPQNMVYAKFDTGYKAGGFTDLGDYGPEKVEAFEVGSKNRFFGNKLQVNLAAFYYTYKDQQVSQTITNSQGAVSTLVLNAGRTRYKGIELEVAAQPTPNDRIDFYAGYLHARYIDFLAAVGGQNARYFAAQGRLIGPNAQLAGNRPQQAPDWSFNIGYEHRFDVFDGELTPRIQTHIESKSYFQFFNFDYDKQPGYHKTDFILSYRPTNDRWSVEAYVRNIENKLILAIAQDATNGTYQAYRYQYQAPRTYGASFTVKW